MLASRRYHQKIRAQRKSDGTCPQCGKPRDDLQFAWCSKCRRRANVWRMRRVGQRKCLRCNAPIEQPRRRRCNQCLAEHAIEIRQLGETRKAQGLCRDCGRKPPMRNKASCVNCRRKRLQHALKDRRATRGAVIVGYGGKCACCGEGEKEFLDLDHVNGGGAAQRRVLGPLVYRRAIEQGFPADYQLHCKNCNWSKYLGGVCVHQRCNPLSPAGG